MIETKNLSKIYAGIAAVNDVTLCVGKGKIYGFLGLNGAGKTTTMRMLLGMIKPTSGSINLFGNPSPVGKEIWQKVGYMVESTHAYPELSVIENLRIFYWYYGIANKMAISEVIFLLQLQRYQHVKAKNLSLGNLQRLGLAKALMHQPELLILDEPVNGLDPSGIVEIRKLIIRLASEGTTVLISSHLLSEIAKIADTIGIIHQGSLIKEIESADLHAELQRKLLINTSRNSDSNDLLNKSGFACHENDSGELEISDLVAIAQPEKVAGLIVSSGVDLKELKTYEEDLEAYFLRTIKENAR